MAKPICLRLFLQESRLAASRIFWTAGSKRAISTPMIAITTSNSIRVNAGRDEGVERMIFSERPLLTVQGSTSRGSEAAGLTCFSSFAISPRQGELKGSFRKSHTSKLEDFTAIGE